MAPTLYDGQRISFEGTLSTVRYFGLVEGTQGDWLGVEWDDSTRGKHNGTYKGREYFKCKSSSKTAGSFVRPSRRKDEAQSFVSAVRQKYGSGITDKRHAKLDLSKETEISGKIVEEVGFDKIRKQQARLHELKIVLVDNLQISEAESGNERILEVCPKIVELDLSRNLFEAWQSISSICRRLVNLKNLRLNGNRLQIEPADLLSLDNMDAFSKVVELGLDEMLLSWSETLTFIMAFPSVVALSVNGNELSRLTGNSSHIELTHKFSNSRLTSLTMEYNLFTSLDDLEGLLDFPNLEKIHLKGNQIQFTTCSNSAKPPVFGKQLYYVDLSYNNVQDWSFVDQLPDVFPGLTSLRFSHNPLYENTSTGSSSAMIVDETYMVTVARLGSLTSLNFSNITAAERTNAELFYLSRIGKAMAAVLEEKESVVISQHRRFHELCELYGAPTITRENTHFHPDWIDARLIKFIFTMPAGTCTGQKTDIMKVKQIPKGFDMYQVKGIVGSLFDVPPLSLRLIWETGQWDPVAGYEEEPEESSDEEVETRETNAEVEERHTKGKWMKREVELEESTRQVGNTVDTAEVKVRVEILPPITERRYP